MNTQHSEKQKRMTTEPVEKLICQLAVPTIVSMMITTFYNMADTFFVTKINTSATGAVGVVFSFMAILQAFGFFFGHGSGNFISRQLGGGDVKRAEKMAAIGFFSALFFGVFLMVTGLIFLEPLAYALGSTESILPYAKTYLGIILLGAPYMTASLVLNNQLRFQGNALFAMVGITVGGVLNVILDPILIYGLELGIAGAAIATVVSQFLSFLLLLAGSRKGDTLKIRWKNFRPTWEDYRIIFNGGVPSLARQSLSSVATIVLNWAARPWGDVAIAALSVVSKIIGFAASVLIGFGQGFQPVCGFNYGAKLYHRVLRGFSFCVRTSTVGLIGIAVLGMIFAPGLIGLFSTDEPEVVELAVIAFRFQLVTLPLSGWVVISNMMLQNIGRVSRASLLAVSRQGLMFIPMVLILPIFFELNGLLAAQSAADVLAFALSLPIQIPVLRELGGSK